MDNDIFSINFILINRTISEAENDQNEIVRFLNNVWTFIYVFQRYVKCIHRPDIQLFIREIFWVNGPSDFKRFTSLESNSTNSSAHISLHLYKNTLNEPKSTTMTDCLFIFLTFPVHNSIEDG